MKHRKWTLGAQLLWNALLLIGTPVAYAEFFRMQMKLYHVIAEIKLYKIIGLAYFNANVRIYGC